MGEYADEYVDSMIGDWFNDRPRYRNKPKLPTEKTCAFCNERSLYWKQFLGRWKLHHLDPDTGEYHVHQCEIGPEGIIKYDD